MRRDRVTNFKVVAADSDSITIRDLGPWDKFMTVTNAPEDAITRLIDSGVLHDGQRLLYYDSSGDLDEIVWDNATFRGFRPWRKEARPDLDEERVDGGRGDPS